MNKVFRFIVGIVFLLSGLLKSIDCATFADLMSSYGATWFGLGAPLIIFVEIILGLLLVFNFFPKYTTIVASSFLILVSIVYIYGIYAKGITNCGCFGPLTWLNTKPWLTLTRNAILIMILVPSLFKQQQGTTFTIPFCAFMALIGIVIMFMCGFSMRGAKCLNKEHKFQPIALVDSPLSNYISCSADSSYFVFAFSYSCPYCQNSIGNVNQYQPMNYVDRVIGLAVEDTIARERFERLFTVNFDIQEITDLQMIHLTTTLPTSFLIRNDSIIRQYSGMVLSPALLLP